MFFSTYLASVIQQLCITVLDKNDQSRDRELSMAEEVKDIQNTLTDFTHKPELGILYIVNALLACFNILILFGLYSLKQYLGKLYLKNTIGHYRAFDDQVQAPQGKQELLLRENYTKKQSKK